MTESTKKHRVRYKEGAIVKIDLKDGTYSYARLLREPMILFYDIQTQKEERDPDLNKLISQKELFRLAVMRYAITTGIWTIIGYVDSDPELSKWVNQYKIDSITEKLTIWKADGSEIPATWDECKNLECAAVWEPEHVEERLRDHFAGRPSAIVESLKPPYARDKSVYPG